MVHSWPTLNMEAFVERLLTASRKTLFRTKAIFEPYRAVEESDIAAIERIVAVSLPSSMRQWLLRAGFGDLNGELSFRAEWFSVIDRGQLQGHVIFAQDQSGNFYAFSPSSGIIHFIDRSASEYAEIAGNFDEFMEGFESHGFELQDWPNSLNALPYDWAV